MSERSDLDFLRDIQEAIDRILRYTLHMSYDVRYMNDSSHIPRPAPLPQDHAGWPRRNPLNPLSDPSPNLSSSCTIPLGRGHELVGYSPALSQS